MISIKRSALLKSYNSYMLLNEAEDAEKKETLHKKYEDSYTLYLETIDKYIIDSVYKKVKNRNCFRIWKRCSSKILHSSIIKGQTIYRVQIQKTRILDKSRLRHSDRTK